MNLRPYLCFAAVVLLWASTPVLVDRLYEEKIGVLFLLASASTFAAATLIALAAAGGRLRQVRSYSSRDGAQIVKRIQDVTRLRTDRDFAAVSLTEIVKDVIALTSTWWRDQAQQIADDAGSQDSQRRYDNESYPEVRQRRFDGA